MKSIILYTLGLTLGFISLGFCNIESFTIDPKNLWSPQENRIVTVPVNTMVTLKCVTSSCMHVGMHARQEPGGEHVNSLLCYPIKSNTLNCSITIMEPAVKVGCLCKQQNGTRLWSYILILIKDLTRYNVPHTTEKLPSNSSTSMFIEHTNVATGDLNLNKECFSIYVSLSGFLFLSLLGNCIFLCILFRKRLSRNCFKYIATRSCANQALDRPNSPVLDQSNEENNNFNNST